MTIAKDPKQTLPSAQSLNAHTHARAHTLPNKYTCESTNLVDETHKRRQTRRVR